MTIGQRIKQVRMEQGWTQSELVRRVRDLEPIGAISHQTGISRSEEGLRELRVSEAVLLAKILGVSLEWLITDNKSEDTKYAEGFNDGQRLLLRRIDELKESL